MRTEKESDVTTDYAADILICSLSRSLDFNEFLETVIDRQGDTRDIYDEILQGFKMFDYGECYNE